MRRNLLILTILSTISAIVFWQRSLYQSKELSGLDEGLPRVELANFVARRYSRGVMISVWKANQGRLYEPNKVLLEGKILAQDFSKEQPRNFWSDRAEFEFKAKTFDDMISGSEIKKGIFRDNIKVQASQYTLKTEYAEYTQKKDLIESNYPVVVEGVKRWIRGANGFQYFIAKGRLTIFGRVKGEVSHDQSQHDTSTSDEKEDDL